MVDEVERTPVPGDLIPDPPMSDRQKEYLLNLIQEREMSEAARREATQKIADGLTKKEASRWIERALTLPKIKSKFEHRKGEIPAVPDGRYALGSDEDESDPVRFYKVTTGAEDNPRWAGFVFLDVFASDETHLIKDFGKKKAILKRIAADPEAASTLYGLKNMRCGVCGRKLTKKESRERGIGPICAERQGW